MESQDENTLREQILSALGENEKNKQIVNKLNEKELLEIVKYIKEQSISAAEITYTPTEILEIIKDTTGMKIEDLKRIKKQIRVSKFIQFFKLKSKVLDDKNIVEEVKIFINSSIKQIFNFIF